MGGQIARGGDLAPAEVVQAADDGVIAAIVVGDVHDGCGVVREFLADVETAGFDQARSDTADGSLVEAGLIGQGLGTRTGVCPIVVRIIGVT